ncbi:unnamed protein product [Ambrosiozyma monospora]|uniref:Unnamed protein product n=1 Tax=Ambrosiozyma monospora TaxID=43982 RepID=A0A9W6Z461_AMBMO|nr:unnamed protein product [Ambrosiozyma monospora]
MAFSNSNLNETGIKLASCLLPEIQHIILKFIIEDFLYLMDSVDNTVVTADTFDLLAGRDIDVRYRIDADTLLFSDHTTITCSNNIQAQILSMTGYDDLLDSIICMALEELELTLKLKESSKAIFIDEFVNFVTSRSVKLKSVEVFPIFYKSLKNPYIFDLLEFHSDWVSLNWASIDQSNRINYLPLQFVSSISCSSSELSKLLNSDLLDMATSLTKFSVEVSGIDALSRVEGVMEHLQLAPSLKHLYLNCEVLENSIASCVDFLVEASTFIRKYKNLNIQFEILFINIPIRTYWRFGSKTQLSLPLHTSYPMDTKAVDAIEQWCSSN